jgi:hypothetical protein
MARNVKNFNSVRSSVEDMKDMDEFSEVVGGGPLWDIAKWLLKKAAKHIAIPLAEYGVKWAKKKTKGWGRNGCGILRSGERRGGSDGLNDYKIGPRDNDPNTIYIGGRRYIGSGADELKEDLGKVAEQFPDDVARIAESAKSATDFVEKVNDLKKKIGSGLMAAGMDEDSD